MTARTGFIRDFAVLLTPAHGNTELLATWIADVKATDLPHLRTFTRGLGLDRDAVNAALTRARPTGGVRRSA
nr:hypothetical protein [Micromonospora pisi]